MVETLGCIGVSPQGKLSQPLIGGVLFDLDGTLIDSEPVYWENDQVFLARYGIDFTEELNESLFGCGAVDFFAKLQELFPLSSLNALPLEERLRLKDEAYLEYARDRIHAFTGVVAFARMLIAQGVPVAIASGSSPLAIERTLGYAGLGGLFAVRVSSVDVPRGKPAPDIFLEAARRLGVNPAMCLVLEDSVPGVQAAKAAGMACIALPAPESNSVTAISETGGSKPGKTTSPRMLAPGFSLADLVVAGGAPAFQPSMAFETWRFA
jgi:HAD superfamily hydrolase (TIGR01509 family)